MEEVRIKLNNVRFMLRIFQNIQIGNRQARNVEFLTYIYLTGQRRL